MVLWYDCIMKTTIDIPDALYRQVKIKAFEEGKSLRAMMINSLRREIERDNENAASPPLLKEEEAIYTTNELGFVVLKRRKPKQVIKDSVISDLRERERV